MTKIAADTARWVESTTGHRVERADSLDGGMSSDVHRCWCDDGSTFVVRHIVDRDWLAREPDLIGQEARALELLAGSDLPAPRHIASDATAGRLLMTFLPGVMVTGASDLRTRPEALADIAAKIAAVPLPEGHGLLPWRAWAPADPQPPDWGDQALWRDGIDAFRARMQPPVDVPVLLHRDLHPLNVLWNGDEVTGLVDWVNACVGHPHAELGHCRWNLTIAANADTADAFLSRYLATTTGPDYDRWWDLAPVMSALPGPIGVSGWQAIGRTDLDVGRVIESTEHFLKSALAHL